MFSSKANSQKYSLETTECLQETSVKPDLMTPERMLLRWGENCPFHRLMAYRTARQRHQKNTNTAENINTPDARSWQSTRSKDISFIWAIQIGKAQIHEEEDKPSDSISNVGRGIEEKNKRVIRYRKHRRTWSESCLTGLAVSHCFGPP